MSEIMDDWNPMLEDFSNYNRIKRSHGKLQGLSDCKGVHNEQYKSVYIKYLPQDITTDGVRNICLNSGNPLKICGKRNVNSATIKFSRRKEAELTIQDLNEEPPYNLKVQFENSLHQKRKLNMNVNKMFVNKKNNDSVDQFKFDVFHAASATKKSNSNEKDEINEVLPYFPIKSEFHSASLTMRQKYFDSKNETSCMSMGRRYLNLGDLKHFRRSNLMCEFKSKNWNSNTYNVRQCLNCNAMTLRNYIKYDKPFCSEECYKAVTSEKKKSSILQDLRLQYSVFDFFTIQKTGFIEILQKEIKITSDVVKVPCCVVIADTYLDYKQLNDYSDHSKVAISAKKYEIIMVCNENGKFLRGIVLDFQDDFYNVALLDYAEIITVKEVYAIPYKLKTIARFSGVATFVGERYFKSFNSNRIKFYIKRRKLFDTWLCDGMINDIVMGEIILEKWSYPKDLIYVPFESNCSVIISSYCEMKTVFLRRIDEYWKEKFVTFSDNIAEYALEAEEYVKLPERDEICGARYKLDGRFYRAKVQSVNDQTITVLFIDYGNEEKINLKDLIYLPCTARQTSCFAKPFSLKNVTDIGSPSSVLYLNNLTANMTELTLIYENNDEQNVTLIDQNSGVVNKILIDKATPVWRKDASVFLKAGDPIYVEAIKELSFDVGREEDIFILNVDVAEFKLTGIFWATRNTNEYLVHLNTELKKLITDYCTYLLNDCYLPRMGELCLAEFEGAWYRGIALDEGNIDCNIFLLDFGIITSLQTKSIRKMLTDFIEMPALAIKCKVSGIENLNENDQQKIVEYMQSRDKNIIKKVKIMEECDGQFTVSIPFIENIQNSKI